MRCYWGFLVIFKGDDYYNKQWKFQVYGTIIFGSGAKKIIARWQPPSLPLSLTAYPTPTPR